MNEALIEMLVESIEAKSRTAQSGLTFEEWDRFMERSIQVLKDRRYYLTSHRDSYWPTDYSAPHLESPPCPTCSEDLGHLVHHPVDRPCTILELRVPTP